MVVVADDEDMVAVVAVAVIMGVEVVTVGLEVEVRTVIGMEAMVEVEVVTEVVTVETLVVTIQIDMVAAIQGQIIPRSSSLMASRVAKEDTVEVALMAILVGEEERQSRKTAVTVTGCAASVTTQTLLLEGNATSAILLEALLHKELLQLQLKPQLQSQLQLLSQLVQNQKLLLLLKDLLVCSQLMIGPAQVVAT